MNRILAAASLLLATTRIIHGLQCPFAHLHKLQQGASSATPKIAEAPFVAFKAKFKSPLQQQLIASEYINGDGSLLLSPLESWAYTRLETTYSQALEIKCPFFRRRASDVLDGAEMMLRFLLVRHKSLIAVPPPMAWRCTAAVCLPKNIGISMEDARQVILNDWKQSTNKGYYITGRLNTTIYRDDCFFDGPDPDMPVKGLRKYLNAASQLFDQAKSRAELLSLDIVETNDDENNSSNRRVIVAKWRMNGVLRLPWKPKLPNWTGTTTYYFDENGMIYKHQETWDMSVMQAFLRTLWPRLAEKIWRNNGDRESPTAPATKRR
ncbi:hypothetical protein MPSEU_000271600 [Mayamaea pseudoterrestris]|nr:hypothetical protein MPSEU_000271600 [Mayamaea pseudoterrestris]